MTRNVKDFENYFLLVLALFLDETLTGRAGQQERIYDLGSVSRFGLLAEGMKYRFQEIYEHAFKILPQYGFNPVSLKNLESKIEKNLTPADEMLMLFEKTKSIQEVMRQYSFLLTSTGEQI
jgi:hypothetical protein